MVVCARSASGSALVLLLALGIRRDRPAAKVEARYATAPSKFLAVDGMRVHYRDRGAGPAVVLLHGSSSSLFNALSDLAAFVEHFVAALGLDHFSLAGNSMGGGVAWHYALAHPEKLERRAARARHPGGEAGDAGGAGSRADGGGPGAQCGAGDRFPALRLGENVDLDPVTPP